MKIFKINKPLLICVATGFSLTISACDNAQKIYPNIYTDKTESGSSTSYDYSNQSNSINHSSNSMTQLQWSALNDDEQVNEIKRIIENYGGELQGLAYSNTGVMAVADIYVLNADISETDRLKLAKTLSELVGTSIVINILDSKVIDDMGSLKTSQLSVINQDQIENFSIYNDEHVNEVASIVESYGAKLQSLGYSGDSELNLSISYYPKNLTKSDFENLERELKQLTGVNITVFRKSISIKPL
ncbi:hypothetical protein CXF58_04930 [Psychrobacter sp. Sarcosine-02u-2]|uniref:hypothetical protein n=1 Tax=Psychrobacter sp. Sarcosine-02u-2 TaxID=2058324 RepID=UPI000C7E6482|nr:hypothetical protein [Psychrobacter sp. Sarcosine-02u-2]PKG86644.1 hypothetical protein CXF58_04930 [Psychrobacter sp. Sarcosine-02u-2]